MSESANPRLGALVKLAVTIVVAGALVAAMLLPWVGGPGLVARNSTSLLDALPVELTDETPNGNTRVPAADGSLITEFYTNNRTPVTPDQVSDVMKQALVDIEDSRFYQHNGLDVEGTMRALVKNLAAGEVEEGGSTLTQQLVKQTLLQTADTPEEREAADDKTVGRKLREVRLALALEETYSKDEILTRYLNIAYFGAGAYGIQAAAQTYFSVNAVDLTLPQASVLAGLVQSPGNTDPISHPEAAANRRNQVLARMHELGHITDQELADISASPIPIAEGGKAPNGCAQAVVGGFFCDYLQSYLINELDFTQTQLDNGGYTIQTTLRPDMQAAGDQAVLKTLGMGDPLAGIYTAVEPGTGKVLAMSVNRQFGCDAANPACESVNLNVAASQGSGSTYKVFTAASALEQGYGVNYRITTSDPYYSRVYKQMGGTTGKAYGPIGNVGTLPRTLTMHDALARSSNTYFVAMEDQLGSVRGPVEMAQRMGLNLPEERARVTIEGEQGSFTLGAIETSPLYLASAYSTLAASGTQCDPVPVVQILNRAGEPLTGEDGQPLVKGDNCNPDAVPAGVANTLSQVLTADVKSNIGTGTRANVPGHQIAGKTGTSQDRNSAAFVGFLPEYAASVMVLNPKGNQDVGSYGGGKPAQIWHDAMEPILNQGPTREFPAADPAVAAGTKGTGAVVRRESNDSTSSSSRGGGSTSTPTTPAAPTTEVTPPADVPAAGGDAVAPPTTEGTTN
ncbi:transglycosylase domain-containing protein [uncultured Modestobacter sp.]|uniref:transglycosylase domain-containing protein n=1 Tax=uncultured Modestobacter sp. TaxID=380048 RepID=UPI002604C418|nr:transglycosylase domain-containing protein [uncultured Modestobacter sp.]